MRVASQDRGWVAEGLRQGGDDGVGHLVGVRRAADVAGANSTAGGGFDGGLDAAGLGVQAEVIEHQCGAGDRADRVGDAFTGDVGRGSVDGLEHAGEAAFRVQVGAGRDAEAACQRGAQVGEDVGVEVGGDDDRQVLGMQDELGADIASTSTLSVSTSG